MGEVDALLRYPLTALLGRAFLTPWLAESEIREVKAGETLLQAGTVGRHAYLMVAGRARVFKAAPSGREVPLGVFGPGQLFGEYALLPPHLNTATCRACEPGRAARLPLAPLRDAVAAALGEGGNLKNWLRLHALLGHLRHGSGLGFLSAPSLLPMLDRGNDARFPAQNTIQADGLGDDHWFYLRDGEVQVDDEGGPPRLLGPGDCFGERGLRGLAAPPTASARTEALCWCLRREEFVQSLRGGAAPSLAQTDHEARSGVRRAFEWIPQRAAADCGVAALTMVGRCLGLDVTLDQAAAATPLGPRGATLQTLTHSAGLLGLRATPVRVSAVQLASTRLPAVAHLLGDHYVALFEWRLSSFLVGDPESGIREMSVDEFRRQWSGSLLLLAAA